VIVECPSCRTRYRTDSAAVIDENTVFECSQDQCRHVFSYSPPVMHSGGNQVRSAVFAPTSSAPAPQKPQETRAQHSLEEFPPPSAQPSSVEPPNEVPEELEDFPSSEITFSSAREEEDIQLVLRRPEINPVRDLTFVARPFFTLVGILVLGYAAFGWYCLSHLSETEAVLARLPLLGAWFTAERFSAQHIALINLKGQFWLTKDGRRVFAVSGKAVNDAPIPARSIQVEGAIYDKNGKVVGQRVIFCGTETASAVLESLTVREIGILQNLVPPKQFNVPAGQSVNFLLVFTNAPPAVTEFSCRVRAAQFAPS
jgi:hypothetical protein